MQSDIKGTTLLIVEDDDAFRTRLHRAMERRGLTVVSVESVEEGVTAAIEHAPDLAIVDLRLEDGNGLTVIEALESHHPKARAIMLTGYGDIPTAVAATRAGAIDYIAKPATAEEILDALTAPRGAHAPPPQETMSPEEARWEHILEVYRKADGNVSHAARLLNMHRRTLQRTLKRHKVQDDAI